MRRVRAGVLFLRVFGGLIAGLGTPPSLAGGADVPVADEPSLVRRITELGRDPQRNPWTSSSEYENLIVSRRQEQVGKIDELLRRFPNTAHREKVLGFKMESLFALSMLREKPPVELKRLIAEITAGNPSRTLAGTARFWEIQCVLFDMQHSGGSEADMVRFQHEQFVRFAADYPEHEEFAPYVLAELVNAGLVDGQLEQAKGYLGKLKKYHPQSEVLPRLEGEVWKRDALAKPFEMKFTDINGNTVDVSRMKGKVVLVDFWASWCIPCVQSTPELKRVYEKYHGKGLEVVGINLDRDRKSLEGFLKRHKIPWPQYFDGKMWNSPMAQRYRVQGIPALFLVDKRGVLRSMDAQFRLESAVAKLLAE